jgi:choline dehydrogenase-like flavoprotein
MPRADVVIVGMGWTGGIAARELADTGLRIVGLERGRFRDTIPDFTAPNALDELRYDVRGDMFQDLSKESVTFRNAPDETALPMRRLGAFRPAPGSAAPACIGTARPIGSCRPIFRSAATPKRATARTSSRAT